MDKLTLCISLAAFLLSAISIIWQFIIQFADMKIDIVNIYKNISADGPQYFMRIHFINNSPTSISVSKIAIVNGDNKIYVDCDKKRLIKRTYKNNKFQFTDGKFTISEKITDMGRLYSQELPFRIDGYGIFGGNFYFFDGDNVLDISTDSTIMVFVYTNKKLLKYKIHVKDVLLWENYEVCME